MTRVATGLENLLNSPPEYLKNKKIGLLAHQASISIDGISTLDCLLSAGFKIARIFGPEHGYAAAAQDMAGVSTSKHKDLQVVSLYGDSFESLFPRIEDLEDLDWLIVDLQDIGSRYYTYFTTLGFTMEQAHKADCSVLVLDRPNPINGQTLEGNMLTEGIRSFVGWYRLPVRHGMTIGELAQWLNDTYSICSDLRVIPCSGWRRSMWYDKTGLPWVLPSPNMPTLDTAAVYPGGCLLEATNLSEGRGTTKPFELFGAPWLDAETLANRMRAHKLEGVIFRPTVFQPTFQKFKGEDCNGLQIHVSDRSSFKSYLCYLLLINEIASMHPKHFAWRTEEYEFVSDPLAIDLLTGDTDAKELIEAHASKRDFEVFSVKGLEQFKKERQRFLIYDN